MQIENNSQTFAGKDERTVPPDTRIPENIDDPRERLPIEEDPPINNEDPTVPRYVRDEDYDLPGSEPPRGIDSPVGQSQRDYPIDEGPLDSPPMGEDSMDTDADGFSTERPKDVESNIPHI